MTETKFTSDLFRDKPPELPDERRGFQADKDPGEFGQPPIRTQLPARPDTSGPFPIPDPDSLTPTAAETVLIAELCDDLGSDGWITDQQAFEAMAGSLPTTYGDDWALRRAAVLVCIATDLQGRLERFTGRFGPCRRRRDIETATATTATTEDDGTTVVRFGKPGTPPIDVARNRERLIRNLKGERYA